MLTLLRKYVYSHAWVIRTWVIQKPDLSDHQFSNTDYLYVHKSASLIQQPLLSDKYLGYKLCRITQVWLYTYVYTYTLYVVTGQVWNKYTFETGLTLQH